MAKRPNIYKSPYKSEKKGVYYGFASAPKLGGGAEIEYQIVNAEGARGYNGMVPWQINEGHGKWLAKRTSFKSQYIPAHFEVPVWFAAETLDDIQAMLTKLGNDLNRAL
jgi:hypothetical protein